MSHSQKLLETVLGLPWSPIILGTLMGTTALGTIFTWRINENLKSLHPIDLPNRNATTDLGKSNEGNASKDLLAWYVSGASRTGQCRSENQDTYSIWQQSGSTAYLAVFDGAGGVEGGQEASRSAAEFCIASLNETQNLEMSAEAQLAVAIDYARSEFARKGLQGITTAILAILHNDRLTYATLGDGALASVWPDGMVHHLLIPHHMLGEAENIITAYIGQDCQVSPRGGTLKLEPGTSLMLMSDGASDLFPYEQYAASHAQFSNQLMATGESNLADTFLDAIERARDKGSGAFLHHDNMTLVLAHLAGQPSVGDPADG